ncbi:MAG: alpha-amylase family glycosyl hydrolase, partial [Spirochaetia bacterium]|nr:alpha-amylase family glycosyl hydrolase [Spirochaetota bacterium]MDW8113000.1 alpha-amylase family glycosyl hydrolase [Spirochaetia bacterium]
MKFVYVFVVIILFLFLHSCGNNPTVQETRTNYNQVNNTNYTYITNNYTNTNYTYINQPVYVWVTNYSTSNVTFYITNTHYIDTNTNQIFISISNVYIAPPNDLWVYVYTNSKINSWASPQLYYWVVGTVINGAVNRLSNHNEFVVFRLTNIDFATSKVGIKLRKDASWSDQEPIKSENGPMYDRIVSIPIYSITNSTTNSTTNTVSGTNYITNRIATIISSPDKIYVHSPANWWESFPYFFESETNLYRDPPTNAVFEWFGANYQGGGVTYFLFYGPNLRRVWVAGDFSGWQRTNMYLSRDRVWWWTILSNTSPGQKYKFVIEKYNDPYLHWISDPGAKKNIYSPAMDTSGNESVIIDHSSYTWQSSSWQRPGYEYYIIYQIHIRTFYTNGPGDYYGWGTFETAINRFDYLTNLGFTAIEPLPINEFAGDQSWGYNYVLYYAPETAYVGTNLTTVNTFKKFVDEAHKRGMAVILDLVFNHIGPGDDIIAAYDPAIDWNNPQTYWYSGSTPWGPSFNYSNPIVKKFLIDSAKYFMKFYKIDGFRFDATYFIAYNNFSSPGGSFLYDMAIQLRQFATNDGNGPNLMLIAENLPTWNWITHKNSGRQDAQWNVDLAHELKKMFKTTPLDLNMSSLGNYILASALDNGLDNQNPYGLIAVQYLSSHDEVANGKRRPAADLKHRGWGNGEYDAQYQTLTGLATAIFARGIPMIFMGDEILEGFYSGDQEWFRDDVPINWSKIGNTRVTN